MVAPNLITIHPSDNVGIVANEGGLPAGTEASCGLKLRENVPEGHKVLLSDLRQGDAVRKYGVVIGAAATDLLAGSWVHEQNLVMPTPPDMENLPISTSLSEPAPEIADKTFQGYRNATGTVGTRNLLGISTTVQCVAGVVDHAVRRIRAEILPNYPHVDGVQSLEHIYGCGVAINAPDAIIPIRTLQNISANPNFGGELMVVSLGCEKLQPEILFPKDTPKVHRLQDSVGFDAMVTRIMQDAEEHLDRLNKRRRETCPASDLVVGLQCGGSDAFSGVSANPALGAATDLIVRAGGTVMFSENTEVRDGVAQLTARCATAEVAKALVGELGWYDDYLARGGVDRSANTTPGNKMGGLSNIVEKAMGSIAKSGTSPIRGIIPPGDRVRVRGLNYASAPANDFLVGTLQLAAGATIHAFTTGRGTPYSLEALPTLKIASRSTLARRWPDLIDIDAGPAATGDTGIEAMGEQVFEHILATASGKRTWAERHGVHNGLALFNPAPMT